MKRILDLYYERLLCNFLPETQKNDATVLSRLNQDLGLKLIKKKELYRYSITVRKHLQIHIAYNILEDISNLVDETTSLLEEIVKNSGFEEKNYFTLNSSRVLPLHVYEAKVCKQMD